MKLNDDGRPDAERPSSSIAARQRAPLPEPPDEPELPDAPDPPDDPLLPLVDPLELALWLEPPELDPELAFMPPDPLDEDVLPDVPLPDDELPLAFIPPDDEPEEAFCEPLEDDPLFASLPAPLLEPLLEPLRGELLCPSPCADPPRSRLLLLDGSRIAPD